MTGTSDSSEVTEESRRSRKWRIGLAVVAVLVAIQSITITLPIRGRILDETSGQPVPGAAVAAFWELDAYGFEVTPGGTVRMAETETDDNGVFWIPMALIVHL